MLAFINDHFENFFRSNMPTIAVGVAETHSGPADQLMEALRVPEKHHFPGNPKAAEHILTSLIHGGFDVARVGSSEFGQNILMPWVLMQAKLPPDVSVVPIYSNVFTPPLMKYSRAFALGEAVARAVETLPDNYRVGLMATGGLSHFPPFW